jgi:hypothetical protein
MLMLAGVILGLVAFTTVAAADTVGPITFESAQGYVVGDIGGQQGWMKANPLYDVKVVSVSSFPAAAGYGFGTQALRVSDAITSGSFGDQTFTPGLSSPAGEPPAKKDFNASFRIGTALAAEQSGLHMSVSPDDGNGGRMSYLRFEDQADGVHVFFVDVTDPGPFPTVATFNETDIATLSRTRAHSIAFSIKFKKGPHNDRVKIAIDGKKKITGTTWEDYYRYDPEQAGNGNQVPDVSKMLLRESGVPNPMNLNKGFLVDGLSLSSGHGHHGPHGPHRPHGR